MITVVRATEADAPLLSGMAARTFVESHGHSAPAADVDAYIAEKYAVPVLRAELADPASIYHLAHVDGAAAGFSKVTLRTPYEPDGDADAGRLDRLYVLAEHHGSGAGAALKYGFAITGSHDFALSPTHANPNHRMFRAL